jgi:hypothetical protein
MSIYNMSGSLLVEGTLEQADYDFEMEWDEPGEPTDLDALDYMLKTGIIQILHEDTELIEEDEDE